MSAGPLLIPRRSFLRAMNLAVGGVALGYYFPVAAQRPTNEPGKPPGPKPVTGSQGIEAAAPGLNPNVFIHVGPDGTTTIVCHRSEMGQGIRSTLPVLIADELGADPARVVVRQAEGDKKYPDQNTDGSTSIRMQYDELRKAGAAARMMLVAAAAKRWKVRPETCTTAGSRVIHTPTQRALGFADVVAAAAKLPVPKKIVPRPSAELTRIADPNLPLYDGPAYVTGTAEFGADVKLPGMLVAVIARPPVVGGKVAKYDATRALAVPGVKRVIEMPVPAPPWLYQPFGGVAVVADNTWAALKGRAALEITWDHGANASYSSAAHKEQMLAAVRAPGTTHRNVG